MNLWIPFTNLCEFLKIFQRTSSPQPGVDQMMNNRFGWKITFHLEASRNWKKKIRKENDQAKVSDGQPENFGIIFLPEILET